MILNSELGVRIADYPAFLFRAKQISVRSLNSGVKLSFNFRVTS